MPPLLQAINLWKSYDGQHQVLKGIELALDAGEGAIIWGRNGSGKTTLLNLLGCLDLPDRGSVFLGGQEVTSLTSGGRAATRLRRVGFIFQDHNLLEELTVSQNIMLPLRLKRAARAEERVDWLLRRFGIEDLAERRPREISMGESQKVAVARALANRPPLLLADEPTASLDEESAEDLLKLLEELRGEGHAIVLASHDSLARDLAWRTLRIAEGELSPL